MTGSKKQQAKKLYDKARALKKADATNVARPERFELYKQIIELDPKHFHALRFYGKMLYVDKKYNEALEIFSRAEKLNPNHGILQYDIAAALYVTNNHQITEDIIARLTKAVRKNPSLLQDKNWFIESNLSEELLDKVKERVSKGKKKSWLIGAVAVGAGLSGYTKYAANKTKTLGTLTKIAS